ncbi:hypothetical protein ART_1691 [Arthrobacter sp. PAMC 25486]|uniref:AAA family ATPase n=1 Tax=Arthrobacter sp. PAMC 25486 TaxID=1494608 RepID=UPI000535D15E|nr:hypothetical protein [Arthrobacter sp. PAMC 25486]AIY01290.1 hypothetical protein ART_1691 [Arthrobacter sp. PAMC 25486]
MSPVTVVSVGDTASFVIAALAKQEDAVQIVRQCPALDQLLAACQSGLAQVAVVAEFAPDLTATLIDRLAAVGVSVVAVAESAQEFSRLKGIGAHPVNAQATPEVLADVLRAAVEGRRHAGSAGFAVPAPQEHRNVPLQKHDAGTATSSASGAPAGVAEGDAAGWKTRLHWKDRVGAKRATAGQPPPEEDGAEKPAPLGGASLQAPGGTSAGTSGGTSAGAAGGATEGRVGSSPKQKTAGTGHQPGTLVAVWGPIGSPGRTTLAMNLAGEQAAAGCKVMLIDADSYGASIAASLGLLDEAASFAQACRFADQGGLTPARLAKTATQLVFKGGTFSLLTGLTRADRWPELRAAAVERVLKAAQDVAELVIVDCGFALENDEELSYDTVAPRRNAATLQVLAQADLVFAVGSGDPIGIPRLIRGLDELAQLFPAAEVAVVVNKVRRKAVGAAPEKSLAQAWERFGPLRAISHFLPWEPELTDKALLEGRLLLELAPDAPLRRAISGISCAADQQKLKIAVSSATAQL